MADMGFSLSQEDVMRMAFTVAERTGKKHRMSLGGVGMSVVILTLLSVVPNHSHNAGPHVPTKLSLMASLPNSGLFMVGSTS